MHEIILNESNINSLISYYTSNKYNKNIIDSNLILIVNNILDKNIPINGTYEYLKFQISIIKTFRDLMMLILLDVI